MTFAYIDPGTGSMLLYGAIATILAIPYILRQSITRAVRRIQGKPDPDETAAPTDRANDPGAKGDA